MMNIDLSIEALQLSNKQNNILEMLNVKTIKDLVLYDLYTCRQKSGIGKKSIDQLEKIKQNIIRNIKVNSDRYDDFLLLQISRSEWFSIRNSFSNKIISVFSELNIDSIDDLLNLNKTDFFQCKSVNNKAWSDIVTVQMKLSSINDENVNRTQFDSISSWNIFFDKLNIKIKSTLSELGIASFEEFLKVRKAEVLALHSVGASTWAKIFKIQLEVMHQNQGLEINEYPLYLSSDASSPKNPSLLFLDTSLYDIVGDKDYHKVFMDYGISTVRELFNLDYNLFFNKYKISRKRTRMLINSLTNYNDYLNSETMFNLLRNDINDLFLYICKIIDFDDRNSKVLCERVSGLTLEEIGVNHNCTRERVRQITKKAIDKISINVMAFQAIKSINKQIYNLIENFAGIIGLDELIGELNEILSSDYFPNINYLESYIRLFYDMHDFSLINNEILVDHYCSSCNFLVTRLIEEIKSSEKGYLSFRELRDYCLICNPDMNNRCIKNNGIRLSKQNILRITTDTHLQCDEDFVYTKEIWDLKNSGLNKKIEAIVKLSNKAVSLDELFDYLNEHVSSDLTRAGVHRAAIQAPNIYVWGRSEYIHKDIINIPDDVILVIKNVLKSKLKDVPFTALYSIFNEFRFTFEKANIPNDYALASVIGLYITDFHLDRYKYVYKDVPDSSTSIDSFIEEILLDYEWDVSRELIRSIIVDKIGARPSIFEMAISRIPTIIYTRDGYIAHIDNLDIHPRKLTSIINKIELYLSSNPQIGIHKIYKESEVKCVEFGIDNSRMLYEILRFYFSERFDFSRYPHITLLEYSQKGTIHDLILSYFFKKNRVTTIDEAEKHFIELGYSSTQIRMIISGITSLIKVYTGCYIHEDLLNWNNEKTNLLRSLLTKKYNERLEIGYFLGDIEDVLIHHDTELPRLNLNINWTLDILRSLIRKIDDISFIGNTKNSYTIYSAENGIHDIKDLVVKVLEKHFSGACSIDQLNDWLVSNNIFINQISMKTLESIHNIKISNYECYLKDFRDE